MYDIRTIDIAVDLLKAAQEFLPLVQDPKKLNAFIQGAEEAKANIENSKDINAKLAKAEKKEAYNAAEAVRLQGVADKVTEANAAVEARQAAFAATQAEVAERLKVAKATEKANELVLINAEALTKQAAETQAKADVALEEANKLKAEYATKLNALIQVEVKNG